MKNGKNQEKTRKKTKTIKKHFILLTIFLITILPHNLLDSNAITEKSSYELPDSIFLSKFNSTRVFDLIQNQLNYGPRIPGSEAIEKTRQLIKATLSDDWIIINQNFSKTWGTIQNITLVNVICFPTEYNFSSRPFFLMAHYDTRLWADQDPDLSKRKDPVPGANDGASGVALALELGKILYSDYNIYNICLVFFDAEDQGNINGLDWIMGSEFFTGTTLFQELNASFGILLDMVGAENATFKREQYSDKYAGDLVEKIWSTASFLNNDRYFINETGRAIIDDHLPLLRQGVPVVDIIDEFGHRYTPWHTTFDNISFIDTATLQAVGTTLEFFLSNSTDVSILESGLTSFNFKSPFEFPFLMFALLIISIKKSSSKRFENSI
ncbi:MAG: M28 family peptidase [Candidatus Hodarchaeales archaeon]